MGRTTGRTRDVRSEKSTTDVLVLPVTLVPGTNVTGSIESISIEPLCDYPYMGAEFIVTCSEGNYNGSFESLSNAPKEKTAESIISR